MRHARCITCGMARCFALRSLGLLVVPCAAALGCADEALPPGYVLDDTPGAAGAAYRPLRPATTPGIAGAGGLTPLPGLNTGGAGGYSPPGPASSAGSGGTPGFGSAGTSGSNLDYGAAGTAGSYGY
jgi:hypothetical protein